MRVRITSGQLLVATGVLHQVVGVIASWSLDGRNLLAEVGVVDWIGSDFVRMAWFWFLMTGFVLMMFGGMLHHLERRGGAVPAWVGWQMGALALVGALAIPASGFWLLFPQAGWIVYKARRLQQR